MEGFSSNLNYTFTSTRGCAEPMFFPQHILPLLLLYYAQLWGYESLTAIVLVNNCLFNMHMFNIQHKEHVQISHPFIYTETSFIQKFSRE